MTTRSFIPASLGVLASAAALLTLGAGAAAAAPDYATLPVNPNVITDSTAYTALAPVVNPDGKTGVQQEFNHRDGTRGITTTIRVLPNPQEATAAVDAMRNDLAPIVLGQNTQPVAVGAGGTVVTGMSPDGSQAVSVLLFSQGDAAVEVQFDGPANDPIPVDLATQYGQDQASAITRSMGA